ncbi:MAG: hypothetical protein JO091_11385, partial [Acidobacteriaceae bacterium]|nr:hypothetical protein [Acidobacteriaceae bacterium]
MSLAILPLFLWDIFLFFLPGFAITILLASRRSLRPTYALISVFVFSSTLGYLAFWVYFVSKFTGKCFSISIGVASLLLLIRFLIKAPHARLLLRRIASPLLHLLAIGACYLSLLFSVANPFFVGQDLMYWRFFTPQRPGDNVIPLIFAAKLYDRQPLYPFCCGDWHSSDRPPLQAGIFLELWPMKASGSPGLNYQLLATGLQCSWVCAVWAFLKALRTPDRRITQALGLLFASAFLMYNSVYTWPKLLAATFVLFAFSILFTALDEHRQLSTPEASLAAACIALALLAHPGSLFSLPAAAILVVVKRPLSLQALSVACVVLLLLGVPWMLYQKYIDPPGNHLPKMHFAGFTGTDSRTTWQTLRDSYGRMSAKQFIAYKWSNVTDLIGPEPIRAFGLQSLKLHHGMQLDPVALEDARIAQREYLWSAIGILNLGWLAAAVIWFQRRRPAIRASSWLLLAGIVNLIFWCVVIFGPSQTSTTRSSYADLLLIMIGLSGFLLALPRWIPLTVMLLEALNILLVWVPFWPVNPDL